MGEVIYSDFSYYYEGEGVSEKLFDYRESIKDYTLIPMHSFDNSIDSIFKRIHGALVERLAQTDPNLISVFFMSYILLVNRHMEEPEPVNVLCIGEHLDWISRYIDADIKLMNPESTVTYARDIAGTSDGIYDVVIAVGPLGTELVPYYEKIKVMSSENCRWIFIVGTQEIAYPGWKKYIFGSYEIITRQERQNPEEGCECSEKVQEVDDGYKKIMSLAPKRVIKTVAAITPHDIPFTNYELIKDIGAVPYLFYKNKNCTVYMVGIDKDSDYSFAQYVMGEELVKLPDYSMDSKLGWLNEHAKGVDCLMLFGTYPNNMRVAEVYKQLNPDGVIYLALDATAFWINNIPRYDKAVDEFYRKCDLIGVSALSLQKFITKKWNMDIRVVRNGYYPFGIGEVKQPDFGKKENRIIAVGRIGAHEKRHDILLKAYAEMSKKTSGWQLRLIGPIEDTFYGFIDDYMEEHPYLEDSISFSGNIVDKAVLHEEFLEAKIFVQCSESEAFTNVIPEAMSAGCAILTTEIDTCKEATNYGRCGLVSPINNYNKLADNIERLCNDEEELIRMSENSFRCYEENYNYNDIIDELYEMLIRA